MELQIVSKKLFLLCILFSIGVLSFFSFSYRLNSSVLYICNDKDMLDMYMRENGDDIILMPQSIKNTLTCLGRGMPYYDRSIELMVGENESLLTVLEERYNQGTAIAVESSDESSYACIGDKKTYMIIQKHIVLDILLNTIEQCQPESIVVASKYRDSNTVRALISQGYDISFIDKGEYKRILL